MIPNAFGVCCIPWLGWIVFCADVSRHLKKLNALLSQALSLQYLPKRTPVLVSNVSDAPSHFCPLKCEDDFLVDAHILKSGRHVPFFLSSTTRLKPEIS